MKKINKKILIFTIVASTLFPSSIMRSLTFPGWGELKEYKTHNKDYIKKRSNIFMLIECGVIISYLTTNNLADSYKDDYESYGRIYADVDWSGKNDIYAINVGKFNSMEAYNNYKISIGQLSDTYTNQSYYWNWNNETNRQKFAKIRNKNEKMDDFASLMIASMLINRLGSFFDVINIKRREGNLFNLDVEKDQENMNLKFNFKF